MADPKGFLKARSIGVLIQKLLTSRQSDLGAMVAPHTVNGNSNHVQAQARATNDKSPKLPFWQLRALYEMCGLGF